jgi:hypothetical protein
MPYIKQEDRVKFQESLKIMPEIKTKGELEYIIFSLMRMYMKTRDFNYSNLHETVYATMHCADEYRRRFLDKREDDARNNNGDIDV